MCRPAMPNGCSGPFRMGASEIASARARRQARDRGQQRPPRLRPCTSASGHGRPGRDAAGTGGRVLRGRGARCCRRRCSGTCRRGHLRHGPRRDSTCGALLAVAPPAGRRAQIQPPPVGQGDQDVDLHGHAIDRRQGSADVQMTPRAVGPPRRIEHARPAAGKTAGPVMLGQHGTQLPQLARQHIGGVKLARSLNLGRAWRERPSNAAGGCPVRPRRCR